MLFLPTHHVHMFAHSRLQAHFHKCTLEMDFQIKYVCTNSWLPKNLRQIGAKTIFYPAMISKHLRKNNLAYESRHCICSPLCETLEVAELKIRINWYVRGEVACSHISLRIQSDLSTYSALWVCPEMNMETNTHSYFKCASQNRILRSKQVKNDLCVVTEYDKNDANLLLPYCQSDSEKN